MKVTESIWYVGVNDHEVDLFEGQYKVPEGMAYNSYVIRDEKTAVIDTVDAAFGQQWLINVEDALQGCVPDYLIIQHMEPDHSACIPLFLKKFPGVQIVATAQALKMMDQFFSMDPAVTRIPMSNGGELDLGVHKLQFVSAPMVHWPEVMMTYETQEKVLFSADGFGKFGALDAKAEGCGKLGGADASADNSGKPDGAEEMAGDSEKSGAANQADWVQEARRYYIGIVGKYGPQVQAVLKKAAALDIRVIAPLHGPVLKENLGYYIGFYDKWSSYTPEEEGVTVAYASAYGHTKEAALYLAERLRERGTAVAMYDLARDDMTEAVADAFRYSKLVLACNTYNAGINPFMRDFVERLMERSYQKRKVGLIENGSWAPMAAKVLRGLLEKGKDLTFAENVVTLMSAMKPESQERLNALAEELAD